MSHEPTWSALTRMIHAGERATAPTATPTATPIYTSVTYLYPNASALDEAFASGDGYVYARHGNPTVGAFEDAMTTIEGGIGAVAFGSGMAALHAAILAAGTPRGETTPQLRGILASRDLYGATTTLLECFFAAQGVPVRYCDTCNQAEFEAALAESKPSVVLVESISNPLLSVADVARLAAAARGVGARLVVDGTMTTPILQRPLALGADLVVHSATKYIGGHSDVMGGVVVARTPLVLDTLRRYAKLLGAVLGPAEAQLLSRGIKTLALRVRQQCNNAAHLARWLSEHPGVSQVYYPGLPGHPQHALAMQMFGGLGGAMLSFDLRVGGKQAAFQFVDALKLILPATSLGDIYSLVSLPVVASHRDLSEEQRRARGIGDGLVRLSIGIEEADDLLADLDGALEEVGG